MIKSVKNEFVEGKKIFKRFWSRDFSGSGGQVIKNSAYSLATSLSMKFGSFLFTIIIARMLSPEMFGFYSLTISTLLLFTTLSDLGVGTSALAFISRELGKKRDSKARAYFDLFFKYRAMLVATVSIILIFVGYYLENNYYQKPIYYALLVGILWVIFNQIAGHLTTIFQANNDFKIPMRGEWISQVSRLLVVPLGVFGLYHLGLSDNIFLAGIILLLSIPDLLVLMYNLFEANRRLIFLKSTPTKLTKNDRRQVNRFILPLTFSVFSGMFFSLIDTIMLGRYVSGEYIGYYGVAWGLVGSAVAIAMFIPGSLMPVFSSLKKKELDRLFQKTLKFTFLISLIGAVLLVLISPYLIILYGVKYSSALLILKVVSVVIVIDSVSAVYVVYFNSLKKTRLVASLLLVSTVLNIILNFFFIHYGIKVNGMMGGVLGAGIATVISRFFYLAGLFIGKNRLTRLFN